MCGIWAIFGLASDIHSHCSSTFSKISHRGPDAWRLEYDNKIKNCCVGFHRLAIVDSIYGMQPMKLHAYPRSMLICNGEIYNCKKLKKQFNFKYETYCDVECIFHLYENFGIEECIRNLDGVFAFCIVDDVRKKIFLGRDPYGVRPLFTIVSESGIMGICSEAKGLVQLKKEIKEEICTLKPFPPGTYEEYDLLDTGKVKLVRKHQYHSPGDRPLFKPFLPYIDLEPTNCKENIRNLLKLAVKKRLMADRRIGCLLSGGLDSSLIASLLVREAKEQNLPYKIQTFAVGMGDSPDLRAARQVSNHIGSEHHEVMFTEEDVARVLDDVIYTLETPDITTIRASIPMYLLSRYVAKRTDTIVLFSGEGADEVAQGYIYFRDAPDAEEAHSDSIRLLKEIYMFDGLRADRTTASQGLELRTPFLDIQFTNYYLTLDRESKQPQESVEKYLLRSSFNRSDILPNDILWREKEAFSDGVTSRKKSLFVVLQEIVDKRMPEPFDQALAAEKYPHCTPTSKEALYYREVFERSYPGLAPDFLPYYWMPRWNKNVTDPSARFIKHYQAVEN